MAVWKIPFMSLNGTSYEVQVDGATAETTLTGAAQPFVTQEDDDDDIFMPVRTQSGYLRIVDTGKDANGNNFNWRDLIPTTITSRPVRLYRGNTVVWRGYLQPQTFSGEVGNYVKEREFPVQCELSVLEKTDPTFDQTKIIRIAELLNMALPSATVHWDYMYFSGTDATEEWLFDKVVSGNFTDEYGETQYSCLELLKEICLFFGWTCRMDGSNIIFSAAWSDFDPAWGRISPQDLDGIAEGDSRVSATDVAWETDTLADADYRDSQSTETIMEGISKATIHTVVNKRYTVMAVPYSDIADATSDKTITVYTWAVSPNVDGWLFKRMTKDNGGHSWTFGTNKLTLQDGNNWNGCYFQTYEWYEGDLDDKTKFNWSNRLVCFSRQSAFVLESTEARNYEYGLLCLSATTFVDVISGEHKTYIGQGMMNVWLSIGDYYWDGNQWTTTRSVCTIYIGTKDGTEGEGTGSIITNSNVGHYSNGNYTPPGFGTWDGFGIHVVQPLCGKLKIELKDILIPDTTVSNLMAAQGLTIQEFKVTFQRYPGYLKNSEKGENVYEQTNNSHFRNEKDVRTVLATFNENSNAVSFLLDGDGYMVDEITYTTLHSGPGTARPEEHNVNLMAGVGSRTLRMYDVNLDTTSHPSLSPLKKVDVAGVETYPIAISHNWRDDITTIKAIEL